MEFVSEASLWSRPLRAVNATLNDRISDSADQALCEALIDRRLERGIDLPAETALSRWNLPLTNNTAAWRSVHFAVSDELEGSSE